MPAELDRSLSYHPVRPDDLPLLADWLERPHWREWWGDPAKELALIRDMVEGRDPHCEPFLFHAGASRWAIFRSGGSAPIRRPSTLTTTPG